MFYFPTINTLIHHHLGMIWLIFGVFFANPRKGFQLQSMPPLGWRLGWLCKSVGQFIVNNHNKNIMMMMMIIIIIIMIIFFFIFSSYFCHIMIYHIIINNNNHSNNKSAPKIPKTLPWNQRLITKVGGLNRSKYLGSDKDPICLDDFCDIQPAAWFFFNHDLLLDCQIFCSRLLQTHFLFVFFSWFTVRFLNKHVSCCFVTKWLLITFNLFWFNFLLIVVDFCCCFFAASCFFWCFSRTPFIPRQSIWLQAAALVGRLDHFDKMFIHREGSWKSLDLENHG